MENKLHSMLAKDHAFDKFDEKMNVRALMWHQKIELFITGKKFLDLGGGDGRTAKRVADESMLMGRDIEACVADVLDYEDRTGLDLVDEAFRVGKKILAIGLVFTSEDDKPYMM